MVDVQVGDVRRPKPRLVRQSGVLSYHGKPPFRVVAVEYRSAAGEWSVMVRVTALDGSHVRLRSRTATEECPPWPSEHAQWKDAKGYEVQP